MIEFRFKYEGEIVTVPIDEKDLDFKDGYCSVYFDIYGFLYSGVIDENFQCVIPFVYTNKEEEFCVTTIFKNHKAIYGIKNEEFYLIDLEQVEFQKENDRLVPMNYIMKFDGYNDLDDEKAILYRNGTYCLYNIAQVEKLSIDFEYMEIVENGFYGWLVFIPGKQQKGISVCCVLNENGKIQNPVHLGPFEVSYHKEILEDKDTLLEETAKTHRLLYSYIRPSNESIQ